MKLSDVRKQLHTLQVENLTGAQIKSAAGEMFLSLDALVSQHDAQDIVKTYKAVKTPTYGQPIPCLLYTSPSPRDATLSRMPSSA